MPRAADRAVDGESYRLTLEGFHRLLSTRDVVDAKRLFARATELDQFNARAFAGLSSTWSAQVAASQVPFDEGLQRAEAAAARATALDSLQGTAWPISRLTARSSTAT